MKRTSIRYRLMVLMICLTTLPVLTVTWIAMNNTRGSVEKEIIDANRSRMLSADQYLDELIRQMDVLFYSLQVNQPLIEGLNAIDNQSGSGQFRTQKYIQETLTKAFYANSKKIDELALYTHQSQKIYSVNYANSGLIYSLDIEKGNWNRMLQAPINMYFKQADSGIYAFHSMNRFADQELLGGLSVRMNKEVWKEVSNILKSEDDSSVFLVNDEGEQLSGSTLEPGLYDIADILNHDGILNKELEIMKTDSHFIFIKRVDDGELTLIKALPITTIAESANNTVRAGIITGLLFALASILLSIMVSLRITRPIVSLARTMRMTPIQQFELTSVRSQDEIGLLERGYNSMMQRMKELVENEYQKEIEVKNAQLMALQAQINPHFLNNTLNLIGGMALVKGAPEIYKITKVIGDLLRYSISSGHEAAALDEELKHIRNYLFIQEQRFSGRCTITIDYDGADLGIQLPRFTLQPLIENAFEHGLQPKEGSWKVQIRVKAIRKRMVILIQDNGIGLDRTRLLMLRSELKDGMPIKVDRLDPEKDQPRMRKGIGLQNVNARLKLHFGESAALRIFSQSGNGTLIALKLPLPKKEDVHE
ncbi:sensor histidine kinase [Paenibacillus sp. LHD-38]|uniref:sensor histidine kinase n=1 Tax=Paenibacillus sp. LHD-38 TaxID=3072143 RepID=UPI00280F4A4F|nr:sensor histidine kinase [Paenibacillus sp. LHD-38]MDQ8737293.1 sensor histidine kinase [Paenibacillus sp. LHD-38]